MGVSWFFDREYYDDPVRPTAHASLPQASCLTHGSMAAASYLHNKHPIVLDVAKLFMGSVMRVSLQRKLCLKGV